jgi:hypothetical protein
VSKSCIFFRTTGVTDLFCVCFAARFGAVAHSLTPLALDYFVIQRCTAVAAVGESEASICVVLKCFDYAGVRGQSGRLLWKRI